MVTDGEFRCAACGGVFGKGWSDDEAAAELGQTFPGFETDDCDTFCDDCYNRMIGRRASAT